VTGFDVALLSKCSPTPFSLASKGCPSLLVAWAATVSSAATTKAAIMVIARFITHLLDVEIFNRHILLIPHGNAIHNILLYHLMQDSPKRSDTTALFRP
jgi:hypothetical protein